MVLRRVMPALPRPFRTPAIWIVGPAADPAGISGMTSSEDGIVAAAALAAIA